MKKVLAVFSALIFALSLCSCSGSSSSGSESSGSGGAKSTGIVGKWTMDSYESKTSRTEGVDFDASMEISDDKTFSLKQTQKAQGDEMSAVMVGTYEGSGTEYHFVYTHATLSYNSQTSEQDENGKFTATLDGDTLTLNKPESSPSKIVMKRA